MGYLLLAAAIVLIVIAHLVRVYRWGLFIAVYERPKTRSLIQATALGYIINFIVPFKLGDIVRAFYSGRRMKNGRAFALSTVIIDRLFDIVVVGLIFVALSFSRGTMNSSVASTAYFYILGALIIVVSAALIYMFRSIVKKCVVKCARVFNSRIENGILRLSYSLISNFKDVIRKINVYKLISSTVIMWTLYVLSYFIFARFISTVETVYVTWIDVFVMLFSQNSVVASTGDLATLWNMGDISLHPIYMVVYTVGSLLVLLTVSFIFNKDENNEVSSDSDYINLLPHMDTNERLMFLENYFSDKNREYIINYLKINQNISIIRDYSAGSNATTMLCMDSEQTFFRKYAFGTDGDKLYQQIEWIEKYADVLPLPEVLRQGKTEAYCYYDMPYNSHGIGLFEYVHTMPVAKGWQMIRGCLEKLESSLYTIDRRVADGDTISDYITEKVLNNLDKIKKAKKLSNLQQYDTIIINGVEYNNLSYYEKYLTKEYLGKVFEDDIYSAIHGDLTIENIICTRGEDGTDDFYIIDPNTGNLHDSPNLDYGKLLQSIHGGYEFLMSAKEVTVNGNQINFLFTKSSAYAELHMLLRDYMADKFGVKRTKSIYFHEIVHWLRLMTYKIDKDGNREFMFYAGMLMVMKDVIDMYADAD